MKDDEHEHERATPHAGPTHHARMAADFRRRFWISLILTVPILVLSPMLQSLVGLRDAIHFPGDLYVLFGLSSAVFWYGGRPFLKGLVEELTSGRPGMMTLISVAIATAYAYSSAVVFGLAGKMFFWELASLVDIMLLGHWIEMKSVMGASRAMEELATLMPSDAHKLMPDGSVKEVPLSELAVDDKVLIKPGEKIPADGVIVDGESTVDEAMLTGESTPVAKMTGGKVVGGSINGEGSLTIEVKGTGKDSFLSQVIDFVKQAQESKSRTQDLANTAIAKAIAAASEHKLPVDGFHSITGKGAEGRVEGKDIKVVSPGYLRDNDITFTDPRVEPLQAQGKTVVFILVDGTLKGAIALADIIRPETKQAIDALKALDIRCMMLTGDNRETAKWVSDPVGLDVQISIPSWPDGPTGVRRTRIMHAWHR